MLTAEQIEARKSGLGGSDIAAMLGLSPWKTPLELYYEKTGEVEPVSLDDNERVHFGNVLEQVVSDEYTHRTGEKLEKRNKMFRHPEHDFLIANIDRKIVGRKAVFEAKTADRFTASNWGETGTEQIPEYYRCQVEHYMNVLGYDEAVLAVLIGGNDFRYYPIKRNADLAAAIESHAIAFWSRVQNQIAPDPMFDKPSTGQLIKNLYPGTNGETIDLPHSLNKWHEVKVEAQADIKRLEAVVEEANNRIAMAMEDNAVGILRDLGVQYKRSEVKRKEFTVEANTFMTMRSSKYTEPKS